MPLPDVPLAKTDFDEAAWEAVIAAAEERECGDYSALFYSRAREARERADVKTEAIFALLGNVTSLRFDPENNDQPFSPAEVRPDSRGIMIDDLNDDRLNVIQDLVPATSDPELQARMADIIWVTKRNAQMADVAIGAYLASAQVLEDPLNWVDCVNRLRRAVQLAASIGRRTPRFDTVISQVESILLKQDGDDPSYLSAKLMELLQEYRRGDANVYLPLAEKAARRAEMEGNWPQARTYWEIQAAWYARANNVEARSLSLTRAAETYIGQANRSVNASPPDYTLAAHHTQSALTAYRRIPGTEQRREEIHATLLEYQARSVEELQDLSERVDVTELAEKARESVRGKSIQSSLLSLAYLTTSPSISYFQNLVDTFSKRNPLHYIMSSTSLNRAGRIIAIAPPVLTGDPDHVDLAKKAHMYRMAASCQEIRAVGVIEPARQQILEEHYVRMSDIIPLVVNNPLIPPGREQFYAEGLFAGISSNFLMSTHILIPQFENSIRYIMNQAGIRTSGLSSNGLQDEFDLNTTLYMKEIESFFSEDLLFDLRGLLIERHGVNLRNKMAHGLLDYAECYSSGAIYLWWIILQLCCLPLRESQVRAGSAETDQATTPIESQSGSS